MSRFIYLISFPSIAYSPCGVESAPFSRGATDTHESLHHSPRKVNVARNLKAELHRTSPVSSRSERLWFVTVCQFFHVGIGSGPCRVMTASYHRYPAFMLGRSPRSSPPLGMGMGHGAKDDEIRNKHA